jgi:hypothetical protein
VPKAIPIVAAKPISKGIFDGIEVYIYAEPGKHKIDAPPRVVNLAGGIAFIPTVHGTTEPEGKFAYSIKELLAHWI